MLMVKTNKKMKMFPFSIAVGMQVQQVHGWSRFQGTLPISGPLEQFEGRDPFFFADICHGAGQQGGSISPSRCNPSSIRPLEPVSPRGNTGKLGGLPFQHRQVGKTAGSRRSKAFASCHCYFPLNWGPGGSASDEPTEGCPFYLCSFCSCPCIVCDFFH